MTIAALPRDTLKTRTWVVVPSALEPSFGVPVYGYFDADDQFHTTPISPADLTLPGMAAAFDGVHPMQDYTDIIEPELGQTSPAITDALHAFMAFRNLPGAPRSAGPVHADLAGGLLVIDGLDVPAIRLATAATAAGLLVVSAHQGVAKLEPMWAPLDAFAPDAAGFGRHTEHVSEDMLAAGLAEVRLDTSIAALEALAADPGRVVPDLVVAAMILNVLEGTNRHHPARRRGNAVLNLIYERAGLVSDEGMQYFLSGLSGVRSALKVLTSMRKTGKEQQYDAAAASPAWGRLMESLVDNMAATASAAGVPAADDIDQVRALLHGLAEESTDPYTNAMTSDAGRLAAGLAEASAQPVEPTEPQSPLASHVRRMIHLLGPHPWQAARPYDFGVLCAVMGSW